MILAQLLYRQFRVSRVGVDAGTDGRSSEIDLEEKPRGLAQPCDVLGRGHGERLELLPQRHGDCVLKLRSAHLEHVVELSPPCRIKSSIELFQDLQQLLEFVDDGDPDGSRVDIVRRLGKIDVVVGVAVLVLAASVAEQLQRPVGDDLVGVHVG